MIGPNWYHFAGGGSYIYDPNPGPNDKKYIPGVLAKPTDDDIVARALKACQVATIAEAGHRTGANCGEPMAAMAFTRTNKNKTLKGAKVVTWGSWGKNQNKQFGVMNPCQTDSASQPDPWGCAQFASLSSLDKSILVSCVVD